MTLIWVVTLYLAVRLVAAELTVHPYLTTPADKASWCYDDTKKGDSNNVCSPTNKCGPSSWKNIVAVSPTVNQCAGQSQTPINLQSLDVVIDQTLTFPSLNVTKGGCQNWVQFSDDHAFEFSVSEANSACTNFKLTYAGTTYTLLQGHTHSPSEHAFGGGFYDGELHLVHKSADGKLLVLGVIFEADDGTIASGSGQSTLSVMWRSATDAYKTATGATASSQAAAATYEWDVSNAAGPVDFYRGFLPPSRAYWTYSGSLTTYPCTEGVTWIVMEQPVRISQNDLTILRTAVKSNPNTIIDAATNNDNRPIQPLKGRTIRHYSGVDPLPTMAPTTVAPTPAPFTSNNNVVAVAAALANSGASIQSALASAYPGIVVSNPTVTSSGNSISAVQNIPSGISLATATTDTAFRSAFQSAVANTAGVTFALVSLGTPTAGRRLMAGVNMPYTIVGLTTSGGNSVGSSATTSSTCFAGTEVVTLENGASKAIADVQIGDRILSADVQGKTSFSDVVYVPHSANTIEATFVLLTTETGRSVKMTTNHILPAGQCEGAMSVRRADAVSVGDCVMTVDGMEKVMDMVTMQGKGIYTVVTNKEYIVVNGIVATPFGGINPTLANIYYNLHRLMYAFMPQALTSSQSVMRQAMDKFASVVL